MEENKLLNIVNSWSNVISTFKKRSDVQNGWGIAWKKRNEQIAKLENVPFGIGDGLGTTGWCVSASEALLFDKVFQQNLLHRNAKAKLISIDIKEQYYGECYNGSQNKWHTAILLEDSGFNIVIDITCRQFGNDFIDKDIWDFKTWQNKLRSPLCKHNITDFNDNHFKITPIVDSEVNVIEKTLILNQLKNITTILDSERNILLDFVEKYQQLNNSILTKNISNFDYEYIIKINELLNKLPYKTQKNCFSVLSFENKDSAKNWIELFLSNNEIPNYVFVSKSIEDSCKLNNLEINDINQTNNLSVEKNKTFVVLEFVEIFGIDTTWFDNTEILLPPGIIMNIDYNNIYNSGIKMEKTAEGIQKETNTIIIKIESY